MKFLWNWSFSWQSLYLKALYIYIYIYAVNCCNSHIYTVLTAPKHVILLTKTGVTMWEDSMKQPCDHCVLSLQGSPKAIFLTGVSFTFNLHFFFFFFVIFVNGLKVWRSKFVIGNLLRIVFQEGVYDNKCSNCAVRQRFCRN